jgi:methylene-tetrahydromethanopterin dehydrogenase
MLLNKIIGRFKVILHPAVANNDQDKIDLIKDADIVFCTASRIQVLNANVLKEAHQLKVAVDVNAVPPAGIEGVEAGDMGAPLIYAPNEKAVAVGALGVGNVKYQVQHVLLASMLETEKPIYLDFLAALFKTAQEYLKEHG